MSGGVTQTQIHLNILHSESVWMLKRLASHSVTSHLVQVSLPNILSCENLRFFLGGFSFIVLQKNTNLTLPHTDIPH